MNVSLWLAMCCVIGIVRGVPLPKNDDELDYRLPVHVSPEQYVIDLTFANGFEEVTGKVEINAVTTSANVEAIYLHTGHNIQFENVQLQKLEEKEPVNIDLDESSFDNQTEMYTINLSKETLQPNDNIQIIIEYNLKLLDVNDAFYITKYYQQPSYETLLATHFQPVNARKVFPCFDEPALKATFQLNLEVPVGYSALSNTEVKKENVSEGINKITFTETPKMSTNLLAFVIYDTSSYFTDDKPSPDDDLKFRTWKLKSTSRSEARTDAKEMGMKYGPEIIKAMFEYSEIPYTENGVSKIDQAALPQYAFEPMETYGLTNFQESVLTYTEEQLSELAIEHGLETMTRTLVHHWIGDRVTPEWWSYLWLSEGFAKYFEYYLTDKVMEGEKWRMDEKFIVHEQMKAMQEDAYEDSVSLTNEDVKTPEDIKAQFGIISSSKGASVLRMFENIVSKRKFKEAVKEFLKMDEATVEPDDFLNKLVNKNILLDEYKTWTDQPGFPLVTIEKNEDAFTISQERFTYALGDKKLKEEETSCYYLSLRTISHSEYMESTLSECGPTVFEPPENDKWYLVSTTGYFRVNYDEENWELLAKELSPKNEDIKALEHAVLVDNALNLARAGKLDYKVALNVVSYLEEEDDYIPWAAAIPGLDFLHHMLGSDNGNSDTIDRFIRNITSHVFKTLEYNSRTGKKNDLSHNEKILRSKVRHLACRAGNWNCLYETEHDLVHYFEVTQKEIDLDLQSSVYCYGHINQSPYLWEKLWDKLTTAEGMERSVIIAGLGCASHSFLLDRYLSDLIKSPDNVIREHEIPDVFEAVYTNVIGTKIALRFLKDNIGYLEYKYRIDFISIIKDMAKYLKTKEQMDELESIRRKKCSDEDEDDDEDCKHEFEKIMKTVEMNKKWKEEKGNEVISAIDKLMPTTTTTTTPTTPTTTPSETTDPSETTVPSTETTTPGGASAARAVVPIIIFAFAFVFNF